MPVESEIMDRFWHSRCLNDCIDLLYMIGLFASSANISLVAKNRTKQPWVKIENFANVCSIIIPIYEGCDLKEILFEAS